MRIIYNEDLNKRIIPYVDKLIKNKNKLDKTTALLFDVFMQYLNLDTRYDAFESKLEPCVIAIIREENIKSVVHLFEGKLNKLLLYLVGDNYAHLFHTYLRLRARCPFIYGYSRRAQRSVNPLLHIHPVMEALLQFLILRATGFSDQIILNGGKTPEEIEAYKDMLNSQNWMAAHIAEGNTTVIEHLRNVLTGENSASRLNRGHLQAIAISGHRPLLELEGKLLPVAKLPEALRQTIVETMDEGCPESYLYLLSIICDNNLQRFASVKRGIALSIGISEQESNDRIAPQYISLMQKFLHNQEKARKALEGEDTVELYLALWSIGFYNTEDIQALLLPVIVKGAKHQVQTLLYFLRCMQSPCINHRISKEALRIWRNDPSVVAAILPLYMNSIYLSRYGATKEIPTLNDYFDTKEEAVRHYEYLKQIYQSISAQEVYAPYVFPWGRVFLTRSDVVIKMAYITWILQDSALKDDLCTYLPALDTYMRASYIGTAFKSPTSRVQEDYILQSLSDRSSDVRDEAYKVLSELTLSPEQNRKVEELLRFKYSEMRINAINLLMKQPKEQLADSIRRLLTDKVSERRMAGLDMMKSIHSTPSMQDIYQKLLPVVKEIQKPNAKEKVLIDSLIGDGTEEILTQHYTKENGFGLYDPALEVNLPEITPDKGFNVRKAFEFISFGKAKLIFKKLNKYIETYKDAEFKTAYGEISTVGNSVLISWSNNEGLSGIGRPELWQIFYEQEIGSYDKLLLMSFMLASPSTLQKDDYYDEDENREADEKSAHTFDPLINRMYTGVVYRGLQKELSRLPYYEQINDIIEALVYEYRDEVAYQRLAVNMLLQLLPMLDTQNIFRQYTAKHTWIPDKMEYGNKQMVYPIHENPFVNFWLDTIERPINDELFIRYFTVHYQLYKLTNYMEHTPPLEETDSYLLATDFVRAWMLGLIPAEEVYREIMGRVNSPAQIEAITTALDDSYRFSREVGYPDVKGMDLSLFGSLMQKVTDRILEIELKRGDSETQVTALAEKLSYIYGAETFINILQAFGKDNFMRDVYNWKSTKRGVLSKLLHACHPLPSDTSDRLKELALKAGLSDQRLVEAAMFAPQWIELTEKAIGWKGLTSAAYYFHAHTNETCDDKKKAIIARYTPIDVEDLQNGALDIDWFKDAYKTLGKQRFEVVYNAARYISCSNSLTRARKFADAISGAVKAADVKKEIIAKRNKDLLMSYGLIPLGRKADSELLERYQYLQQFLKESKQFGAQRQESEKKAVSIALQNLARNSGYGDVTRLTWSMETELIKDLKPFLTPKKIDGVEMYVEIGKEGKAEIRQIKEGKTLASMPAKLKKHPYAEELKEVHKKLKEQYSRSLLMLEQAMEDCIRFEESELRKLMHNPVIWPLLKHIVFICNGQAGFYTDRLLVTANAVCLPLKPKDELRIAHPGDLSANGDWPTYQKFLFDKAIRQPFKQVFRELYLPTPEEAESIFIVRYAGNRVHPRKTLAVLKGRRWVADYADGLQKIYYKENIIANMHAIANWFSPADTETPTLQHICFYDRKDYKALQISEVPPVIFSEVMRDVDLAISAAHAGSVAPETSPSTIEMRSTLAELTLSQNSLTNVKVKGNFACIEGKRGKYTIHLGSGVVRQEGGGEITVLPMRSQSGGRPFLPFVDDDPKTAEILAKIIIFAEDDKIKDAGILSQIK